MFGLGLIPWLKIGALAAAALFVGWLWVRGNIAIAERDAAELRAAQLEDALDRQVEAFEALRLDHARTLGEIAALERASERAERDRDRLRREVLNAEDGTMADSLRRALGGLQPYERGEDDRSPGLPGNSGEP